MRFEEWLETVPEAIANDSLWRIKAYRLATFAADLGWEDVTRLAKDRRSLALAGQLYRALGSIGANLAEGYSRGTGPDRARFYEYALGSARECRDWYYKSRHVLGPETTSQRLEMMEEIIKLLLTMVPQQRGRSLREEPEGYEA